MENHIAKLLTQFTVIAVIAYVVASAVGRRDVVTMNETKAERKGKGAMWQTPLAYAPGADDSLGLLAG